MTDATHSFNQFDHFWIVGGNTSRVWSSYAGDYVDMTDLRFKAWSKDNFPTRISSEPELIDVLRILNIPPYRRIDGAEFLARLTDAEYGAILAAAAQSGQLARWLDIFRLRGEIDVTGSTAQAAKTGLVAAKLLTQARADVIFAPE